MSREPLLLVDDDRAVTASLGEFLEAEGYRVVVATTGGEALARLAECRPAVVLLDLQLPDMDGLAVMKAAQRYGPADVIIITGHASLDSAIAALESGTAGYIVKPIHLLELRSLLAKLAERRRLVRENARLGERADRDHRRLEALYEISRRLAAAVDADEILRLIVAEATRLLEAEAAGLRLLEGEELVVRARTASATTLMLRTRIRLGESLSGRVVAGGQPLAVENLADDNRYDPVHKRAALATGFHGFLGVPLRAYGRTIGALNVYTRRPRRFAEDEISLLQTFADHAALAIEKARLLAEAQTERARVDRILQSTSDGIIFVARDGRIEAANRRATELFGLELFTAGDLTLADLLAGSVGPDGAPGFDTLKPLLDEPERGGHGDLTVSTLDRVLHWVARATEDASGRTVGLTVTFRDVTEEREVSRMKSDFVSFVTHQLRTPLAGIKWMLELAEQPTSGTDAIEYVKDARDSAERLIRLVNDLLDVARLEAGKLPARTEAVDLAALTRDVLHELDVLVASKAHAVRVEIATDLPDVRGEGQLLRQVVLNLVSNAIKYTPDRGSIVVRAWADGDNVAWSIEDSGIGIPRECQHRLFQKFYRADNAQTMETEGTGLGLYLVRLIVERFGGQIACDSAEGRGATFEFRLPCAGGERR
jgi:signal transduction histidine kinase